MLLLAAAMLALLLVLLLTAAMLALLLVLLLAAAMLGGEDGSHLAARERESLSAVSPCRLSLSAERALAPAGSDDPPDAEVGAPAAAARD